MLLEEKNCEKEKTAKKSGPESFPKSYYLYCYFFVTASKGFPCTQPLRCKRVKCESSFNMVCCVPCAKNIGEWCDVRHTMCDARHISVCSVTFVTTSVALVTGTTPVSSLGWAWLLLFVSFHSFLHLLFFLFYLCFK